MPSFTSFPHPSCDLSRPPSRRTPLGDATDRPPQRLPRHSPRSPAPDASAHGSSPPLPHPESLRPLSDVPSSRLLGRGYPEKDRLSALAGECQDKPKRNSHASTASSGGTSRRKTHVGPWQLGATLGRGATARVRKARHVVTGQQAAIKIVSKAAAASVQRRTSMKSKGLVDDDADGLRQMPFGIEREVVIMKLIDHPHVIQLYDIWENRGELYLVLEYVRGGELFDYLVQHGHFDEWEAVRYLRQILAGLTHCHNFGICHRDLKPENILMDRDHNVKLADFGMAALQPRDHLLNTSCGSPNYAAPEILEGRRYHGSDVDIWSCGIVLYAMLVGRTPFDDVDVPSILRNIKAGRFDMPDFLSDEARDLLWNMLQLDSRRRIGMDQIWAHPLLRRYDAVCTPDGTVERYARPPAPPSLDHVTGRAFESKVDIDPEILRNLQSLWHAEAETILVQRLMDDEPNQEKHFYWLLLQYRERHLEDYPGPSLEHSASDYHHGRAAGAPRRRRLSTGQVAGGPARRPDRHDRHDRHGSQFSILSDRARGTRPRAGYYEDPATARTVESYDPFRSSRAPVQDGEAGHANVTLLPERPTRPSRPATARGRRDRGQDQRRSSSRTSMASSRPRGGSSRSSLASSSRRSSPIVMRPSSRNRRRVSFSHQKQTEATAAMARRARSGSRSGNRSGSSSPPSSIAAVHSRKDSRSPGGAAKTAKKGQWREEARQVSSELERFCDEAFNGSPRSSSPATDARSDCHDLTVSSRSVRDESLARHVVVTRPPTRGKGERAPPPPPVGTLDLYTESQLAATRERLALRSAEGTAGAAQGYLDDVIAHLDRLMQPSTLPWKEAKRNPSAETEPGHLPPITEESWRAESDEACHLPDRAHQGHRAWSEPTPRRDRPGQDTIRVVPPSSSPAPPPTPVAPLNVRKHRAPKEVSVHEDALAPEDVVSTGKRNGTLQTIHESDAGSPKSGKRTGSGLRWFKLGHKPDAREHERPASGVSSDKRALTGSDKRSAAEKDGKRSSLAGGRTALLKMFGRPKGDRAVDSVALDETASLVGSPRSPSDGPVGSPPWPSDATVASRRVVAPPPTHHQQSWLSRLLHIRPASKVVCFAVGRARVRREIVIVLRSWRLHGLRDVAVDKRQNVISGRVDARNSLELKPVSFVINLHGVLDGGDRGARLTVAKLSQESGAASSFHKVADSLEMVLRSRGFPGVEAERRRAMEKLLG
ncbi:MAG: hypothetical protein M1832_002736 [Thelocarpon impressellum]|nr:MAG: hypothetical protein M1832_002736 [Thelocarpon impressellum]